MIKRLRIFSFLLLLGLLIFTGCGVSNPPLGNNVKIIFLHHSTGGCIWGGGVPEWFSTYNSSNGTNYQITERAFPSGNEGSYPWDNYPYDYWNIWVRHAGTGPYFKDEPTLEMLSNQGYKVIIWKHCFPVSEIGPDNGTGSISSPEKTLANYKLQYNALRTKMRQFPGIRFLVWTGAALIQSDPDMATRARQFFAWVKNTWNQPGDNIFVWDFYELETEGSNYLKLEYATSSEDSHPNATFSQTVAPYFCQRIVDVIQGQGDAGSITGQ